MRALVCAFAVVALMGTTTHANLLVSDQFDYSTNNPLGPVPGDTNFYFNNGGTGFSDFWGSVGATNDVPVVAPGLDVSIAGYTNVEAGNSVGDSSTFTYAARPWNALDQSDGTTYYFSMLFQPTAAAGGNARIVRIFNDSGASNQGFGINANEPGTDLDTVKIAPIINANNQSAGTTRIDNLKIGTTYLLVGRLDLDATDTFNLWAFEDGADISGVDFTGAGMSTVTGSVGTQQGLAVGRNGPSGTDTYLIDEFFLGDEAADVKLVPEPASVALFGLAGLALLRRRG